MTFKDHYIMLVHLFTLGYVFSNYNEDYLSEKSLANRKIIINGFKNIPFITKELTKKMLKTFDCIIMNITDNKLTHDRNGLCTCT